ncbi:NXPE family member 3-like [Amphiura filiformis]|uniref:NXPE family member 3-like n=1 Tax=Amphiura filiformis TaxID=82378 RepID=UPI003B21DDFF
MSIMRNVDYVCLCSNRCLGILMCVAICWLVASAFVKVNMPKILAPQFARRGLTTNDTTAQLYAAQQLGTEVPKRNWIPSADEGVNMSETNATNCRYYVLNSGSIWKGDIVKIRIDARDKYNQARFVGGDFWFAWLDSKKPVASTAGKVIDYNNGTYLVKFLAAWDGPANITIILVHPSDATTFMKDVFWNTDDKIFWQAIYQSPHNPKVTQTVLCTIQYPGIWENKCIYPRPIANGRTSFICDKPPGLPCSSIAKLKAHGGMINKRTTEILGDKTFLFEGGNYNQKINGDVKMLNFKESPVTFPLDGLPNCQPQTPIPAIKGYWMDNQWHPFNCRKYNCWTDSTKVAQCLRNKKIHIMGDSNGRQYYQFLFLLLPTDPIEQPELNKLSHMHRYIKTYNISMTFDFHPEGIGSPWMKFSDYHYEVDILDQLVNTDCNYVIIISSWAHFVQWKREGLLERFHLLREAVDRFHHRCPNAPVILKSPHPREHPSFQSRLFSSDFMLNEIRRLLRKIFANSGAFYLDVWDMNLAHPAVNNVHMPGTIITQELFMILSYVCNSLCEH